MLKKVVFVIIIFCFIILMPGLKNLWAADFSLGAAVWYAWWDPWWKALFTEGTSSDYTNNTYEMSPSFLYGPVISFQFFEDWSLSGVFVWGNQYTAESEMDKVSGGTHIKKKLEITKYDLDTTLNYNLNSYIKFFAGLKYQGYSYTEKTKEDNVDAGTGDIELKGWGPGAGIGFTYPLGDSLFVLWNISGLYLKSVFKISSNNSYEKHDLKAYGFNTNISMAYYLSGLNSTLSLGFRYQYLKLKDVTFKEDLDPDKFYGITFSAIYSF